MFWLLKPWRKSEVVERKTFNSPFVSYSISLSLKRFFLSFHFTKGKYPKDLFNKIPHFANRKVSYLCRSWIMFDFLQDFWPDWRKLNLLNSWEFQMSTCDCSTFSIIKRNQKNNKLFHLSYWMKRQKGKSGWKLCSFRTGVVQSFSKISKEKRKVVWEYFWIVDFKVFQHKNIKSLIFV